MVESKENYKYDLGVKELQVVPTQVEEPKKQKQIALSKKVYIIYIVLKMLILSLLNVIVRIWGFFRPIFLKFSLLK